MTWDQARFAANYQVRVRNPDHPQFGQVVGYSRTLAQVLEDPYSSDLTNYVKRAQRFKDAHNPLPTDNVAVVGCGFGFLVEALMDLGVKAVGIESSAWIKSRWSQEARADVKCLFEDVRMVTKTQLARAGMPAAFSFVITESVLEDYPDPSQILSACENLLTPGVPKTRVVHFVYKLPPESEFVSKDINAWRAVRPTHSFELMEG